MSTATLTAAPPASTAEGRAPAVQGSRGFQSGPTLTVSFDPLVRRSRGRSCLWQSPSCSLRDSPRAITIHAGRRGAIQQILSEALSFCGPLKDHPFRLQVCV